MDRYLGITFPFEDDPKGKYFKLDQTAKDNIKSRLTLLLTTKTGERLYKPRFGLNLARYQFEPMDKITYNSLREEVVGTVQRYIKEINILNVEFDVNEDKLFVGLRVFYEITDGFYKENDQLNLKF